MIKKNQSLRIRTFKNDIKIGIADRSNSLVSQIDQNCTYEAYFKNEFGFFFT